jgi:hypothetical protein
MRWLWMALPQATQVCVSNLTVPIWHKFRALYAGTGAAKLRWQRAKWRAGRGYDGFSRLFP